MIEVINYYPLNIRAMEQNYTGCALSHTLIAPYTIYIVYRKQIQTERLESR